jgi:predicted Zn-dependent peptidase
MKKLVITVAFVVGCGSSTQVAPPPSSPPTAVPAPEAAPEREAPPPSATPREVSFPPIARSSLDNGLELNTVALPQLPLVYATLIIKHGSADDPDKLPGVAQLTGSMLKEGTRRRSSAALAEAIEFLGASITVHTDEDATYLHARAVKQHFDEVLGLLAEVATRPSFRTEELGKLKKRELARLALARKNPRFLARREFRKALYGDHPYSRVDTTPAVVQRVKQSDLKNWHRAHFVPNDAVLVVAGDVSAEGVAKTAGKAFARWKPRKVSPKPRPAPPAPKPRHVILVDRPESVQSVILIGNRAIARKHPDWIPFNVANQVLGGSAASRLFMDLREKRSLTYGAYSDVGEQVDVAPFVATAAVRNEVTAEAMSAFVEHLDRIVREPAPAQELADAQRFLADRFPLRIDTAGKIANLVAELRVYDLPDDYWDRFRGRIREVTAAQALTAAQAHIHPNESVIIVVGKAADVKPALETYGPVTVVDVDGNVVLDPAATPPLPATTPAAAEPAPAAATPAPAAAKPAPAAPAAAAPVPAAPAKQ